jgi:hypothetical protein
MPSAQRNAVAAYRRKLKKSGLVRLEVKVRKADAPLVRRVVTALSDPGLEVKTRALLRKTLATSKPFGLKALLAAAPLEGIDLTRERDVGRDIDL